MDNFEGDYDLTPEQNDQLHDMLERHGITPDLYFKINEVRVWQSFHKDDATGEAVVTDLMGASLEPILEVPEWPAVQPAQPLDLPKVNVKKRNDGLERVVILPDPQIGFWRKMNGSLEPFHDEQAIEVALAITKASNPDRIVNLGDTLDFPEFGKYEQEPEFQMTTQQTLDYGYTYLARQRNAAPNANIDLLEGNHDKRLGAAIKKNLMAALRLRRAQAADNEWPVMSVQHLLRLNDLRIDYRDGYPAGKVRIRPDLHAIHGIKVASNNSTAAKVVKDEAISKIFGHVHRLELQWRTIETEFGPKQIFGMTPGCLSRIDGGVPSFHGGLTSTGDVVPVVENWQQGVGVVDIDLETGQLYPEVVPIINGRAIWRGEVFSA